MNMAPADAHSLLAGAQGWWELVGVAEMVGEEPTAWLAPAAAPAEPPQGTEHAAPPKAPADIASGPMRRSARLASAAPPLLPLGGDWAAWPDEPAAFADWWRSERSLDDGGSYPRVAPAGSVEAELALFAPMPCADDSEELFGGEEGRLLQSFCRAAGVPWNSTYRGTVLPRHTPLPDWTALAGRGLGDILHHHLRLARPRRLVLFGKEAAPLLEGAATPCLLAPSLGELVRSPARRKRFWDRWLHWTGST